MAESDSAIEESSPLRGKSPTILAAEDNQLNQYVLRQLLKPHDVTLSFANDGREAIDAWKAGRFDLILMDIQMPRMDGMEATSFIRSKERESGAHSIPIVAITADMISRQSQQWVEAGFTRCINKPIDESELVEAIADSLISAA